MIKEMIVSSTALETKIAILEDDQIAELYIERTRNRGILGNIYKGRVTKVLPGMQSAFVNIGLEKDAFLYVTDFIEDTEEYDKVFTEAENKVVEYLEQTEPVEPTEPAELPQRRERRPERSRFRDRRESGRPAPTQIDGNGERNVPIEAWNLTAQTELETQLETRPMEPGTEIPPPAPQTLPQIVAAPEVRGNSTAETVPSTIIDEIPRDSAEIRDDGQVDPFATDGANPRSGSSKGRRGPGARRRRFTTARHKGGRPERQSIGDILREGQEILVQIAKEPIAKKGARVTSHIALPGRYLVFMPTVEHIGVSRKIASEAERIRLKDVILKNRDQFSGGFIVRTAAEERSEEDLVADLNYLVKLWESIRARMETSSAPAIIHEELNLVQRLLRDQFSFEFAAIRVADELEFQRVVEFVDKIYPNLVHRVKLHTMDNDIFDEFGVTPEIEKVLQPKIWLKSGGYIVINQTEALVSIDINTGKFVGRGNSLEETITRTNLEAVKEIVKQIRLRDLGGIIVIDFIDMDERKNRKRVMEALSQEISRDRSPSKILEFNEFGLVAITRKRVKQSLERTLCQPCPYCTGSGLVKAVTTTCYTIYNELEKMKNHANGRGEIMIRVHPDVARALRETEANVVQEARQLLKKDIVVKADPSLHIEHYNIVF